MLYYDQLTNDEKMLVNSEIQNDGKNSTVAYLLWFFLGYLGAHNFYLDKKTQGAIQLSLFIIGWLTLIFLIGGLFFFILGIWVFIDLFQISKGIEQTKDTLREQKAQRIITLRQSQEQ